MLFGVVDRHRVIPSPTRRVFLFDQTHHLSLDRFTARKRGHGTLSVIVAADVRPPIVGTAAIFVG
jgi:hypothetical protein